MIKNLKKILFLLTPNDRKYASFLLVMILIMALLDMIGVASILPFMMMMANPEIIETNIIFNKVFNYLKIFGVENKNDFLFIFTATIFFLLIISIFFKALTTYFQVRFIYMQEFIISKRLVEGYLNQPYTWFLSRHSSDLGKNILSEVSQVIGYGMKPLLDLLAKSLVAITLIVLLILVDPKIAFVVGSIIGSSYLIIFYFAKGFLSRIGKERLDSNQFRFNSLSDAFGATKEIKLAGLEQIFINRFSNSAQTYARTTASSVITSQLPRFGMEAMVFGGVLFLILYYMSTKGSLNSILPIISLYVFAGYRLMPAIQQIYMAFTQLAFVGPSVNSLSDEIKNLDQYTSNLNENVFDFKKEIVLNKIEYTYPNSSRKILNDLNIKIPIKSTVGIIGATGSGKTSLVDIILGLLKPQKGFLEIDGITIDKNNLRSWQNIIGYVPQGIFLLDDTITANIAFGTDPEKVDINALLKASKIANIHNFVQEELPNKYSTIVGERGVRLSGGQIQRIGIARALYHNPKVLILDEATSALDSETEHQVMDSINNLSKNLTIIIIAHRMNTLKNCDVIYKFDKGKIIEQEKFHNTIKKSSY